MESMDVRTEGVSPRRAQCKSLLGSPDRYRAMHDFLLSFLSDNCFRKLVWRAQEDLNLRPLPDQGSALTLSYTPTQSFRVRRESAGGDGLTHLTGPGEGERLGERHCDSPIFRPFENDTSRIGGGLRPLPTLIQPTYRSFT